DRTDTVPSPVVVDHHHRFSPSVGEGDDDETTKDLGMTFPPIRVEQDLLDLLTCQPTCRMVEIVLVPFDGVEEHTSTSPRVAMIGKLQHTEKGARSETGVLLSPPARCSPAARCRRPGPAGTAAVPRPRPPRPGPRSSRRCRCTAGAGAPAPGCPPRRTASRPARAAASWRPPRR